MVISTDCRISPSVASQLHGAAGLVGRKWSLVKFCNGQLMGKKLKLTQLQQIKNGSSKNVKQRVCMSLTAGVASEAKLRDLEMEKRDPRTVVAIILGGGAGTRLFPLTKRRAKPAVPIGGAYRLIDVPMSNCINSGINKVYILTQFNSASLNRHLARAYNFGSGVTFGDSYVEVLAATQTPGEAGKSWFQGTADAVRQFHWLFEDPRSKDIEDVIILSGDHLYRMDYMDFVQHHRQSGADITLSCLPMNDSRASDFGLMKIDQKGRILSFSEKPKGEDLKAMAVDTTVLGLTREEAEKKPYIASMGVYVFKKEILLNLLRWRFPTANDFGSEIIPASASEFFLKAYLFNDYWEDIGTIRSFFEANLALTEHPPRFSFYDATKPMFTSRRNLPPSNIDKCKIVDSIISHGSFLTNCFIEHSVVGIRSRINSNVQLKDTVMLGADFYETDAEAASLLAEGRVPLGIGENTKIKDCIIDKNARIGKNVVIANSEVTTCKHEYHLHCILEWLGRSKQCPVCWQLLILKDPACQELLGAIERERKSRLRKISFLAPPTLHYSRDEIQTEHGSFTVNSNVDGKMQHLANATSSNLYLSRRERHRSSRHHPSQVLVSTSLANVLAGVDNADTAASEECRLLNCGSYEGDSLASNRGRPHGVNSGPLLAIAPSSNGDTAVNGGVSINPTFLYSQSPPDLLRSTSSDASPPSESIKSKFSAASARYKESFSKSTKNFKEKLLERNASVKELRKEVQREMSAGVTRMIKCFDHIASKRVDGESSNFNFKGKAVLEDVIAQTFNKHRGKGVDEITSDAASHTPIAAAPGGVEVSQAQSGHGC